MNNKWKRVTIGFVLPMIIMTVVCIIFYLKNANQSLLDGMETEEVSTASKVVLSKKNWEEYFTLETKLEFIKNEEGELEKVFYIDHLKLKEEYRDKIALEYKNYVILSGTQPRKRMCYKITDASSGEWEITGPLIGDETKFPIIRTKWSWGTTDEGDFERIYELEYGEYLGQIFLEVPEENTVEAVQGELYFDYK